MAKPDMPYGPFPFNAQHASTPAGALAVDLATAFRWYWRVKSWTASFTGSFTVTATLTDGSTITVAVTMGVSETFDVLGPTYDELSLCQCIPQPIYPPGSSYLWIPRAAPAASIGTSITDSRGYTYAPATVGYYPIPGDGRGLFIPPESGAFLRMTRDPSSGLFTPFLGDGTIGPLWLGGNWGELIGEIGASSSGFGGELRILISSEPGVSFTVPPASGNHGIAVSGSVDGDLFTGGGFAEWALTTFYGEPGGPPIASVTYPLDSGSISLTIRPLEYWTYAPRIDPGNPTYDLGTGKIEANPATGEQWTIQEIISRQGP